MLDSIDAWILTQPSLVNKRNRSLLPVVRERTQLADALARYLGMLGLSRRHPIGIPASPHAAALKALEAEPVHTRAPEPSAPNGAEPAPETPEPDP
jgi:hypothetical protein